MTVLLSPAVSAALEAASERYGLAAATVAQACIERGLPLVRDSLRKQARTQRGDGA
jgi:hypothetical protein